MLCVENETAADVALEPGAVLGVARAVPEGLQGERRGPHYFPVIAIGNDDSATVRSIAFAVQRAVIEPRGHSPVETIAMIEIIGPFAITQQIAPLDLDFDDDDPPLGVDTHKVRPPPATQRHFGQAPYVVACEQPRYAPRDMGRRMSVQKRFRHVGEMEHTPNIVKA